MTVSLELLAPQGRVGLIMYTTLGTVEAAGCTPAEGTNCPKCCTVESWIVRPPLLATPLKPRDSWLFSLHQLLRLIEMERPWSLFLTAMYH